MWGDKESFDPSGDIDIKRIYHSHEKWEEIPAGMWNIITGNTRKIMLENAIDFTGEPSLQKCQPKMVAIECLKAAILNLPLSKALGFAYVVAYKGKPTFTIGYKGLIQLAMRTGAYKCINSGPVYEGELKKRDKLSGTIDLSGDRTGDEVVGYFCYLEMLNGFNKVLYMSKTEVESHGAKLSPSFKYDSSPWKTHFDAMATKTVIRNLLSKYGMMTIEMQKAIVMESDVFEAEYRENANSTMLPAPEFPGETINQETGEIVNEEVVADLPQNNAEPSFAV